MKNRSEGDGGQGATDNELMRRWRVLSDEASRRVLTSEELAEVQTLEMKLDGGPQCLRVVEEHPGEFAVYDINAPQIEETDYGLIAHGFESCAEAERYIAALLLARPPTELN